MSGNTNGVFNDGDVRLSPWEAQGTFNNSVYEKVAQQFGVQMITQELVNRLEKLTGCKPHRLLRRGLFFAHRGLGEILDDFEAGKPIFLYTGRGPSGEMHLGHYIPMEFTAWLQQILRAFVIIQIADDEKYWFKDKDFDEIYDLGKQNSIGIIAFGFNPERTFIFSNHDFKSYSAFKRAADDMLKVIRFKDIQAVFGIKDDDPLGRAVWAVYQSVAAFSQSFGEMFNEKARCLVAYAIDQDPYFRLSRDYCHTANAKAGEEVYYKPCGIMSRFLPSLEGDGKMSTTVTSSKPVFMSDSPKDIYDKIIKFAFSGGQDTKEKHRELGGNTDVDVPFQWLRHFMEDDDELERIRLAYSTGKMLTMEIKKICANVVTSVVQEHQDRCKMVTPEIVSRFYSMDGKRI